MKKILLKYVLYFSFVFFVGDVFSQRGAQSPYYSDSDYSGDGLSFGGIIGAILVGILGLLATGIFAGIVSVITDFLKSIFAPTNEIPAPKSKPVPKSKQVPNKVRD